MRKCAVAVILLTFLCGCSVPPKEMDEAMELRSQLLQASSCSFEATVTADYGDKVHIFTMACKSDSQGNLAFTVTKPETLAGISGRLTGSGGTLTFEDTALHFPLLAEDQLSPISAPWILVKTLRSGYMSSACTEGESVRLSIDDSYEDDPLRLDIWLTSGSVPERADILYDGRRILSVSVVNFEIL